MRKGIAKLWVNALRSGQYEQTTGQLKDENGNYCCLGVLCDLAAKRGVGSWNGLSFFGKDDLLPREVMEWADMSTKEGSFYNDQEYQTDLSTENDNGKTFEEIADIIESEAAYL